MTKICFTLILSSLLSPMVHAETLLAATASTNSMQFFIAPPQRFVKWDNPTKLATSFLKGWLKSHQVNPLNRKKTAMGHGMVHVDCVDEQNVQHEFWTGITGTGDTETDLVMKEKVGIGIIFMNFDNGYIQHEDEVKSTLSAYRGRLETSISGQTTRIKPRFLEFSLSPKQCTDAVAFYSAFRNRSFGEPEGDLSLPKKERKKKIVADREALPENKKLYFGLTLEPYDLYMKNGKEGYLGGGCTSYASAFLKITGNYDEIFDHFFKKNITSSVKQMGSKEDPVSLVKLVLGKKGKSWEQDFTDTMQLSFYDPEKMWGFIDSVRACQGDPESVSECLPAVKKWLEGYEAKETSLTVTAPFKGEKFYMHETEFTNTIDGVHLTKKP